MTMWSFLEELCYVFKNRFTAEALRSLLCALCGFAVQNLFYWTKVQGFL